MDLYREYFIIHVDDSGKPISAKLAIFHKRFSEDGGVVSKLSVRARGLTN